MRLGILENAPPPHRRRGKTPVNAIWEQNMKREKIKKGDTVKEKEKQ
jgi:hypothetical protein